MKAQRLFRGPLIWILLGGLAIFLIVNFFTNANGYQLKPTSEVIALLNGDEKLKDVTLVDGEQEVRVVKADGTKIRATWVGTQSEDIVKRLNERVSDKTLEKWQGENPDGNVWGTLLFSVVPFLLFGALLFFFLNSAQSGGNRLMGFGKSKAKIANKGTPQTTFADVAGAEEAIEELQEIKEFLSEPARFQAVGAKIPKGVLLYGPPGTGKTLLARAVAGEAGVPFFSISGSDFVEMFVGVGASRVRDLFEQAKEAAPAIVFIDEIDAVGRHRGAGMGGGHDEREQTLNQLLVEMDGFDVRGGVILIAATNRPDVLDPALLRPGRFDRQIPVEAPDMAGRLQILRVHAKNKPMGADANLERVAARTPGFTGADLANVLNEAALLTARNNQRIITAGALDEAIDRVVAGPQRRSRIMDERDLLITAYHEGGHALVAAAMPGNDPVQKITILPRGKARGYTMVMPDQDKYSRTRGELLDQLAYMLGGRAAEEMVFHDPTTGASNDIEKATKVARAMVTEYGMTESLGAVRLGAGEREPFVGRDIGEGRDYSEAIAAKVDEEVARLIHNAHQEAFEVLTTNRAILDELVRQLFAKETLDKDEVARVFEGLQRWPNRGPWTGSDTRLPSNLPPVPVPRRPRPAPTPPHHVEGGKIVVPAPGTSNHPPFGVGSPGVQTAHPVRPVDPGADPGLGAGENPGPFSAPPTMPEQPQTGNEPPSEAQPPQGNQPPQGG